MKVRIKTAHGYLSFQPPLPDSRAVRLEYRETAGSWEEIEIDDWVLEPILPAVPLPLPRRPPVQP